MRLPLGARTELPPAQLRREGGEKAFLAGLSSGLSVLVGFWFYYFFKMFFFLSLVFLAVLSLFLPFFLYVIIIIFFSFDFFIFMLFFIYFFCLVLFSLFCLSIFLFLVYFLFYFYVIFSVFGFSRCSLFRFFYFIFFCLWLLCFQCYSFSVSYFLFFLLFQLSYVSLLSFSFSVILLCCIPLSFSGLGTCSVFLLLLIHIFLNGVRWDQCRKSYKWEWMDSQRNKKSFNHELLTNIHCMCVEEFRWCLECVDYISSVLK